MKRLFLAGHSDSGSQYLPAGMLSWPVRTRDWLTAVTAEPWELVENRFTPLGDRAADYLMGKVELAKPDIVVLPLGAFVCTIGTVAESVRARFGERAARWFLQSESRFEEWTLDGRLRRPVNRRGRATARRILGTKTLATVEQTTAIFEEILHRLAQVESLQVVAIADARFSAESQKREPALHDRIDRMHATLLPVVQQHHFLLADVEGALRQAPDRRDFYQDDGVHTTAAFHDVYFRVMQHALRDVVAARLA